ncbi:MAG: hypothetical protein ABEK29_00470, partial [Bradymonadaceae bacterium]
CKEASCTPESCDGCCKNDECQSGDTDQACGTGAETCETCSGEAFCQDGECTAPCSERCDGCCTENGECKAGSSADMCGTGGDMCQSCGDGQECRGGCVETNCEVSCEGCCVDGTCKDGTSDDTCGRNGAVCKSCPKSFGCDQRATGGACVLQDESTWDIVAVRGKVPKTNKTLGGTKDEKWDEASKPDVFLKVTNDTASKSGKTSVAKDSLEPSWGEKPIKKIAAGDLTGSKKTTLKLVDNDIYDNDHIATCEIQFKANFGEGQFDGKAHEFVCKEKHAGDEEITTKVWLKLKHN